MTTAQKMIKTKVGVLELARQLANVSWPARSWVTVGTASTGSRSCTTRVEKKRCAKIRRRKSTIHNRVAGDLEAAIVAVAIDQPAWGQIGSPTSWPRSGADRSWRLRCVWVRLT